MGITSGSQYDGCQAQEQNARQLLHNYSSKK
jgi:hypothetical protein